MKDQHTIDCVVNWVSNHYCLGSNSFAEDDPGYVEPISYTSFSSNDLPIVSRVKKYVTIIPAIQTPPRIKNAILTRFTSGKMSSSWCFVAHKKPTVPTIAPNFPAAPDIPWHVDLNLAGKSSAGIINVVVLGPKLLKKKINP